jgi:hypothetical protein
MAIARAAMVAISFSYRADSWFCAEPKQVLQSATLTVRRPAGIRLKTWAGSGGFGQMTCPDADCPTSLPHTHPPEISGRWEHPRS